MTQPTQALSTPKGRVYPRNGEHFVSVTTGLNALPKPALMYWAAKKVAESAADMIIERSEDGEWDKDALVKRLKETPWKSRDSAGADGDEIHSFAEAVLKGEPRPELTTNRSRQIATQFLRWMDDYDVVPLHIEPTVYNDSHRYAGSCDLMALVDDVPTILDFKTSKGVYGSVALQLAAYRFAEYILTDDGKKLPIPTFMRAAVLHLKPRSYSFPEVRADWKAFLQFVRLLETKREWIDTAEQVALLPEIKPKKGA